MLPALLQDRVEFIQMFMENGADLDAYLTPTELAKLYREVRLIITTVVAYMFLFIVSNDEKR